MKHQHRRAAFAALPSNKVVSWLGLLCLAAIVETRVHAAEPAPLSLRAAIDATLQANPQLDVYRFREAALDGLRVTANLQPPLQVTAGVENAFGSGDLKLFDSAELTLSL